MWTRLIRTIRWLIQTFIQANSDHLLAFMKNAVVDTIKQTINAFTKFFKYTTYLKILYI